MKGYTLLEVLLVIAVLALLFVVGFSNYRDYERRQKVSSITRQIKADLRLAQESAIAGKKPQNNCDILEGYAFWLDQLTKKDYKIYVLCRQTSGGSLVAQEVKSYTVKEPNILLSINPVLPYTLPPTLSSSGGIQFKALAMGTNIPDGSQVTLTVSGKSSPPSPFCILLPWLPGCPSSLKDETITITPGGEVR